MGSGSGILAGIRLYTLSHIVDSRSECGALYSPWFFPVEGFHVKIKCLLLFPHHITLDHCYVILGYFVILTNPKNLVITD